MNGIKFFLLNMHDDQFVRYLPPNISGRINSSDTVIYGAGDNNGKLLGFTVFSYSDIVKGQMNLEYIYIMESARKKAVAKSLLNSAFTFLKGHGARSIVCKVFADIIDAGIMYKLMVKTRFLPLRLNGHFLQYFLEDLEEAGFYRKFAEKGIRLPDIQSIESPDDKRIRLFLHSQAREKGFYIDKTTFHPKMNGFYLQENSIKGAAWLRQGTSGTSYMVGPFVMNDVSEARMGLALLMDIVQKMITSDEIDIQAARIAFQIFDEKVYSFLTELMGPCEDHMFVQEYIKVL